ncbi:ABC transporter permease [Dyadobacter sp. SG02]|uniref:ABC transporter permease n=1 Tax=Dyadobacter sp. SG02 TaxID=1855291 RepID=UPI000B82253C|nr:ABC transporter permease [Dyadobacter sp. SG02]
MLGNYLKIAFRNLLKNKGYASINILGLAMGMAVALLIGLWVRYEWSFDNFHENRANIVRVKKKTHFNNHKGTQDGIMLPLAAELRTNFSEAKYVTRVDWGDKHSLVAGDQKLSRQGYYADPDFLKMFTFPLVKGRADQVLKEPHSIVLTETLAKAMFGSAEPMGKVIRVDNQFEVMVTGILKDIPKNSSFQFDYLMPYELNIATSDFVRGALDEWGNNFLQTYVQLHEGVTAEAFSARIANLVRQKMKDKEESLLFVHPMPKWHLFGEFKDWVNTGGAIEYVRLFAVIGVLVLLIACINFMNLSTARSEKRAREVGIRKAVGSQRKQLIAQFLTESMLTALLGFVIALLMVEFSLPYLKNVGFEHITFSLNDISLLGVAFAGCIVTGLLAGSYPALYLSGFVPVKVLKGTFQVGKAANLPRKILVVTQFTFSIALIIGTVIVFQQIQHAKSRPMGYNPEKLIWLSLSSDLQKNFFPMKTELMGTGYVEAVSRTSSPMTGVYNQWEGFSWPGKDPQSQPLFTALMVDPAYFKAAGLKLKDGRFFAEKVLSDSNAIVLNEASVKLMGFKNPVGSHVRFGDADLTVIGVTKNVIQQNPYDEVQPAVMLMQPDFTFQGLIRFKSGADLKKALTAIQPVIEKYNPSYPFEYRFVDDEYDQKFRSEAQIGQLAGIFAALAILISCLGLFGLASFMAERRTKEIGVRKVLGASVSQLWLLLSRDFVLLVLISCAIASPLAYYFLQKWLGNYNYHINISPFVFLGAGVSAVLVTLATISFQSIRAALMNPVKSLRTE